jgi:branched-chain amino acid transport system substrate-binding protein
MSVARFLQSRGYARTALPFLTAGLCLIGFVETSAVAQKDGKGTVGEPIRIGTLYSLTGAFASLGEPGLRGMQLAVVQINAGGGVLGGGVLGRSVALAVRDTRSQETGAAAATAELIRTDRVIAIGGLTDSGLALAAGAVAQNAAIPFVTAGATLPSLPERIGDTFFMACYGDDDQAAAVADFAADDLKATRAASLTDPSYDYTVALSRFFRERFTRRGGTVLLDERVALDREDLSAPLARLKALNPPPDVVFVAAVPDEAGKVTKRIREAGLAQPILSGDGFDTAQIAKDAGPLATEVYYATHAAVDDPEPRMQRFVADYRAAYGKPPENAFAMLGYDTLNLIVDAIRRAGIATPEAVRAALAATREFRGVTGAIAYRPGQRKPSKPVTIVRIQNGAYAFVKSVAP